jgi:hypothetical protein
MNSIVDFFATTIKLLLLASVVAVVVVFWGYNKIRLLAESVKEALANISISTRKKVALINQLTEVAKDYQKGEQLTMLKTSEDLTVTSMQLANQQSGQILAAINGVAQRFPELKSNQHYNRLMDSIQQSELALEAARTRYNQVAKVYNVERTSIPHVFYAQLLGFNPAQYLTVEAIESRDAGIQQPIISDDGERVNELLARAGTRVFGVAKTIAEQGRMLAEKGVARVQQNSAPDSHDPVVDAKAVNLGESIEQQCQNCAQPVVKGAKFCSNCGFASITVEPPKPASRPCVSCGAENSARAKFCRECGKALLGELPAVG